MINLLLAAVVSVPVPGARAFPPLPPPPPVENLVLSSAAPSPAPTFTPATPPPQPQQEEPPTEGWGQKFLRRYFENKRSG
jgi:hypothetical protein